MVFKGPGPMKDGPLDNFQSEEMQENLLDKLNFRLISLSVVFPILLVIGLVSVYFVVDYRMGEKQNAAAKKMEDISQDIDGLKIFFSEQTSESKKSLMDRIGRFGETLERTGADLADLKKKKTDKKTVGMIVQKELAGIVKSVEANRGDAKKQEKAIRELVISSSDQKKTSIEQAEDLAASKSVLKRLGETVEEQRTIIEGLSDRMAEIRELLETSHKEQERLNEKIESLELELKVSEDRVRPAGKGTGESVPQGSSPSQKDPAARGGYNIKEETIR